MIQMFLKCSQGRGSIGEKGLLWTAALGEASVQWKRVHACRKGAEARDAACSNSLTRASKVKSTQLWDLQSWALFWIGEGRLEGLSSRQNSKCKGWEEQMLIGWG
jgi:hypothetical protein